MRILRGVRKKLLENDKLKKYLLYSLGEIVIVVFGILIAIYLNNNNLDTKIRKEIVVYESRLDKEIERELYIVENAFNYIRDTTIHDLVNLRDIIKEEKVDSAYLIGQTLYTLLGPTDVLSELPALNEFIAKGYLSQLEDEELNQLIWYLEIFAAQAQSNVVKFTEYQFSVIHPFLKNKISYGSYIENTRHKILSGENEDDLKSLLGSQEFENILTMTIIQHEDDVRIYENYCNLLKKIKDRIDKTIK